MVSRTLTVLRLGSFVSKAVPLGPLLRLMESAGTRVGPRLMPDKAAQLERHIQRLAADGRTDIEPQSGAARGFGSYARYWAEFFRLPHLTDRSIDRGFSFIGYGKLEAIRDSGVGPILVLPHLGGWEWAAAWLGRIAKVDVTAVVEKLEPEEVFQWFVRLRRALGVNVIPLGPRAMVELTAAVKRRDIVCLLTDRDIRGNGVEVCFFGETTTLPAGPALLSRRTGAPLVPTAVYYRGRQRICLVGDPIWPDDPPEGVPGQDPETARTSASGRARNVQLMQEVADRLEDLVSLAPDQWHLLDPNWPSDRAELG